MNNLKELMKANDKLKYSKKKKKELIAKSYFIIGKTNYLVICMEELGELIEVVANNVDDGVDYIHTVEEIVDSIIAVDILKMVFDIEDSQISKIDKKKSKIKKKSVIFSSMANLAKAQRLISKNIRNKKNAKDGIIEAINLINESIYNLTVLFKVKQKDITKIENLKYKRMEDRISAGTLC